MKLILIILLICLIVLRIDAQSSRDMNKERIIQRQLEALAPGAVEIFKAATSAMDSDRYAQAVPLFEQVVLQVPKFDPALRRLGLSLVQSGERVKGIATLRQALAIQHSPENLGTLAECLALLGEKESSESSEKEEALSLAREAMTMDKKDLQYAAVTAQIALLLDRMMEFREATEILAQTHPESMITHYFNAILAISDEEWSKADEEIDRAEQLGLEHERAELLRDSGVRDHIMRRHLTYSVLSGVGAWLAGLLLLFVIGKILSRRTLNFIDTENPNGAPSPLELAIRKYYKALINIAGVYYYVSIPVVALIVIALAGAVTLGFFAIGRLPIQLLVILDVGALITVYKMVRSIFVRVQTTEPGRSLSREEAPGLWALAQEVAEDIGTRPIDEIRITPGTELAVYEKGSFRERRQDRAQRILILGTGVLRDFQQDAFRAILAHEYGHFAHRDTAGGDIAMRVHLDMMKFAQAMIIGGQAVWWNMGFQFLRLYHFLFQRISHGATRLQEVLADRVAVYHYGNAAFEQGLRHVIRRHVEFDHLATQELQAVINGSQSVRNLYEIGAHEISQEREETIEQKIEVELMRQTTEDNTHPCPADRFRLAGKIHSKAKEGVSGEVWELFAEREKLTNEMHELIAVQVNIQAKRHMGVA